MSKLDAGLHAAHGGDGRRVKMAVRRERHTSRSAGITGSAAMRSMPGVPAVLGAGCSEDTAGAGALADVDGESADGACGCESHVAGVLRARHRAHRRGLRHAGREAVASGVARLAGSRVSRQRLEHEADAQADRDVGDVPAVFERAEGTARDGSGQYAACAADRGCGCRRSSCAMRRCRRAVC